MNDNDLALAKEAETKALALTDRPLPAIRSTFGLSIHELAESMYLSGMFKDIRSVHQAKVKIIAGAELGIPPVQALNSLYIIEGKVAMAAALMAGMILRDGRYKYRITQLDDTGCSIMFYERNDMHEWVQCGPISSFSRQDAQTAGLLGKDVWKKWFRNMAFARALSNGARWYCSDVFYGPVYVPEELGAIVNEEGDVVTVEIPTHADENPKPKRNDWQREAAKIIYPRVAPNVAEKVREMGGDMEVSEDDFTKFLVDVAHIHAINIPTPPQQAEEATYVDIPPNFPSMTDMNPQQDPSIPTPAAKILIEIKNGVMTEITCNQTVELTIVDLDIKAQGGSVGEIMTTTLILPNPQFDLLMINARINLIEG